MAQFESPSTKILGDRLPEGQSTQLPSLWYLQSTNPLDWRRTRWRNHHYLEEKPLSCGFPHTTIEIQLNDTGRWRVPERLSRDFKTEEKAIACQFLMVVAIGGPRKQGWAPKMLLGIWPSPTPQSISHFSTSR